MKCPHCGSPMGLEDEFCSFCGKPNEFAKKHQEDMKHYHKEFKETQEKVYKKTVGIFSYVDIICNSR